jgi:hypothetical protein
MGPSKASGERKADSEYIKLAGYPDSSGFLGYYPLNHLGDPFLKRYELGLEELPYGSYWFVIEKNRFKVYREDVKLGEEKKKQLKRVEGKKVTIEIQRGMGTNQHTYKWG